MNTASIPTPGSGFVMLDMGIIRTVIHDSVHQAMLHGYLLGQSNPNLTVKTLSSDFGHWVNEGNPVATQIEINIRRYAEQILGAVSGQGISDR